MRTATGVLALLAQAAPASPAVPAIPPEIAGPAASGGIATLAIAVLLYLVRHYTTEIKEITARFQTTIDAKDKALADLVAKSDALQERLAARYEALSRENRDDNRRRDEQWTGLNKEMVAALEHVSGSMDDTRAGMADMKNAMQGMSSGMGEMKTVLVDLSKRVEGLERPKGRAGP